MGSSGSAGLGAVFSPIAVRRRSAAARNGNRGIFVPPSQRFRPAQRCLLSPLGTVPSGTALSPARGMLGDSVSWKLLCASGVGLRMLAWIWGGQRGFFGVGDVELAQQWESPPVFLFGEPLQAPVPQAQSRAQDGAAAVRRFPDEQCPSAERQECFGNVSLS